MHGVPRLDVGDRLDIQAARTEPTKVRFGR
jgi:hypothetical protein